MSSGHTKLAIYDDDEGNDKFKNKLLGDYDKDQSEKNLAQSEEKEEKQ